MYLLLHMSLMVICAVEDADKGLALGIAAVLRRPPLGRVGIGK